MTSLTDIANRSDRPDTWRVWVTAARPRTLGLSVTPVLVGLALARAEGFAIDAGIALATLLCAMLIQIGTNLHNDAADHEAGNDRPDRLGPLRVTSAGWASPRQVRLAAGLAFALALCVGAWLACIGGLPIVLVGLASLGAGWAYSGGPRPISYTPLGEAFVWMFFGLVAVAGSHWLQSAVFSPTPLLAGGVVGGPAAAVLMVNNLRDLDADRRAGRLTLAAVLGLERSVIAYAAMLFLPFAGVAALATRHPGTLAALLAVPAAGRLVSRLARERGAALNDVLAATARHVVVLGLLLACGLLVGGAS